ncbi:MAG TPA: phosphoribosyltransferase family protein [Cyclobacteriaceae bacterium]|nr:phosphoribosyltransferase family protein [Cyclobacteriaceae bacterium]
MRPLPQPDRIAPFANRDEAAMMLAAKLDGYRNTDALVLTVPPNVYMGKQVAATLGLRSRPMPCLEIRHPANRNLSIGSVCLRNVVLHDAGRDIPQEYIQHAIARLRAKIQRDMKEGSNAGATESYRGKTLIVVSDWLKTADRIHACLDHIREELPARIVIATAVVSPHAVPELRELADEVIYLVEDDEVSLPQYYFGPEKEGRRGQAPRRDIQIRPSHNYA